MVESGRISTASSTNEGNPKRPKNLHRTKELEESQVKKLHIPNTTIPPQPRPSDQPKLTAKISSSHPDGAPHWRIVSYLMLTV